MNFNVEKVLLIAIGLVIIVACSQKDPRQSDYDPNLFNPSQEERVEICKEKGMIYNGARDAYFYGYSCVPGAYITNDDLQKHRKNRIK